MASQHCLRNEHKPEKSDTHRLLERCVFTTGARKRYLDKYSMPIVSESEGNKQFARSCVALPKDCMWPKALEGICSQLVSVLDRIISSNWCLYGSNTVIITLICVSFIGDDAQCF